MSFHIGQKVACVGGAGVGGHSISWWRRWAAEHGVVLAAKGRVYTVRHVRAARDGSQRIRLVEIANPLVEFNDAPKQEPWFIPEMIGRAILASRLESSGQILADATQKTPSTESPR